MRKLFVSVLVGLCVCLASGCGSGDGTPNNPQPSGTYLTWDNMRIEIYVTNRPIQGVDDYRWIEPGTGEYSSSGYYYSEMGILIPHATRWSDGTVTLSVDPYEGVNYISYAESDNFLEFNDTSFRSNGSEYGEAEGTEPDFWDVGTAPNGRSESDYTYDPVNRRYVYSGNSAANAPQQAAAPAEQAAEQILDTLSDALSDEDADDEDVNATVNENDGLNLNSNRR